MQRCEYCGRESENAAAACRECGISFAIHFFPPTPAPLLPTCVARVGYLLQRTGIPIKQILLMIAGGCWIAGSLALGLVLLQYIAEGAGWPLFGWGISSGSVLFGFVQVMGLVLGSGLCLVIGIGLCAHGIVRPEKQ